jgi:hypothetical protein
MPSLLLPPSQDRLNLLLSPSSPLASAYLPNSQINARAPADARKETRINKSIITFWCGQREREKRRRRVEREMNKIVLQRTDRKDDTGERDREIQLKGYCLFHT